jgi:hypothetical protein
MTGRPCRRWLQLLAVLACAWAQAAQAEAPQFIRIAAPVSGKEAFADVYGQLMVDEMHKALLKDAQPSCLIDRNIARADILRDRGEELLVRFGDAIGEKMMAAVDADLADREFVRLAGGTAMQELRTLIKDPVVAELLRISRIADRDRFVDRTTETFDRYVLLHRIKIDRISPIVTGSTFLMEKSRAVAAEEEADAFVAKNGTPAVKRYLELVEAAGIALEAAADRERLALMGPTQLLAGLDEALAALCVED